MLTMALQLLSNNHASVMFVKIIGIKSKYIISFNPTPYSLLPTPYSLLSSRCSNTFEKWYNIAWVLLRNMKSDSEPNNTYFCGVAESRDESFSKR